MNVNEKAERRFERCISLLKNARLEPGFMKQKKKYLQYQKFVQVFEGIAGDITDLIIYERPLEARKIRDALYNNWISQLQKCSFCNLDNFRVSFL